MWYVGSWWQSQDPGVGRVRLYAVMDTYCSIRREEQWVGNLGTHLVEEGRQCEVSRDVRFGLELWHEPGRRRTGWCTVLVMIIDSIIWFLVCLGILKLLNIYLVIDHVFLFYWTSVCHRGLNIEFYDLSIRYVIVHSVSRMSRFAFG